MNVEETGTHTRACHILKNCPSCSAKFPDKTVYEHFEYLWTDVEQCRRWWIYDDRDCCAQCWRNVAAVEPDFTSEFVARDAPRNKFYTWV